MKQRSGEKGSGLGVRRVVLCVGVLLLAGLVLRPAASPLSSAGNEGGASGSGSESLVALGPVELVMAAYTATSDLDCNQFPFGDLDCFDNNVVSVAGFQIVGGVTTVQSCTPETGWTLVRCSIVGDDLVGLQFGHGGGPSSGDLIATVVLENPGMDTLTIQVRVGRISQIV